MQKGSVIVFVLIMLVILSSRQVRGSASLPTIATFDIGGKVYQPYWMAMNGHDLYVVDGTGSLARIDTATIATQGLNAISAVQVFPFSSGGCCGNFVASLGIVIRSGFAWIGGEYNYGQALSKVSLLDLSVETFFPPYGIGTPLGLVADDSFVYIAGSGIARFSLFDHSWSTIAPGAHAAGLWLNGSTIWFTRQTVGIGKVNTDGTNLTYYSSGFSSNTVFLANATNGRIWFTENNAHMIGVFDPVDTSVVEYAFGSVQDGPYGLAFDAQGKLWVAGEWNGNIREFDPSSRSWNPAADLVFSGEPFFLLKNGNDVWGDIQSIDSKLIRISVAPQPIPVNIEIQHGTTLPTINSRSHGTIPVAILSSPDLNAFSMLNRTSLTFGKTGSEQSLAFCNRNSVDMNGDELPDLLCHFGIQAAGFGGGDSIAFLSGMTIGGSPIQGKARIRVVGP
ncbi:hypothetical protein E6H34_05415 [Candidatus Bathyarchaeota archaeon]|nr:MAG: hypothetical protein E6H34_05415 [Candidatus Bathyarchaeota archaeon]